MFTGADILSKLIDWISWKYIGSTVFGAIVAVTITHFATKRREKEKLIKDIQIKTIDELTVTIENFRQHIIKYQDFLRNIVNNISHYNLCINDINANRYFGENKRDIFELYKKSYEDYRSYDSTFFNKVDARKAILSGFWGMRNYMFDHSMDMLINYYLKLYNILYGVDSFMKTGSAINDETIIIIKNLVKEYDVKLLDMLCFLEDFQIGLQNEYLSKLFGVEIPVRKVVRDMIVLKVGLHYECQWYNKQKNNEAKTLE